MNSESRSVAFTHKNKPYFAVASVRGENWIIKIYDEENNCLSPNGLIISVETAKDASTTGRYKDLITEGIYTLISDFENDRGEFQKS